MPIQLIKLMANQWYLENSEFIELVNCTLPQEEYINILEYKRL